MADDSGGVTLKIDADTAEYITKILQAAEHTKKLPESVREGAAAWEKFEEFAKEALKTVAGFAPELTLAGAAMGLLEKATEAWREDMEKAKETMSGLASLNQAIIASGRGAQTAAFTTALEEGAPGLNEQEKKQVFSGYVAGNANASPDDIRRAAEAGTRAATLGRDLGAFARLQGTFDRAGVAHSEDTANYLMQYAPEIADRAAIGISKFPAHAAEIAEMAATAQGGGRGTLALFEKAINDYTIRGGQGSFRDSFNIRTAGRESQDDLRYMENPRNQAPFLMPGVFEDESAQARADSEAGINIIARESTARAESMRYQRLQGEIRHRALADAVERIQDARHGTVGNIARDLNLASFDGERSTADLRHYMSDEEVRKAYAELIKHAKETSENTERPPLRPLPGVHGEGHR